MELSKKVCERVFREDLDSSLLCNQFDLQQFTLLKSMQYTVFREDLDQSLLCKCNQFNLPKSVQHTFFRDLVQSLQRNQFNLPKSVQHTVFREDLNQSPLCNKFNLLKSVQHTVFREDLDRSPLCNQFSLLKTVQHTVFRKDLDQSPLCNQFNLLKSVQHTNETDSSPERHSCLSSCLPPPPPSTLPLSFTEQIPKPQKHMANITWIPESSSTFFRSKPLSSYDRHSITLCLVCPESRFVKEQGAPKCRRTRLTDTLSCVIQEKDEVTFNIPHLN